MKYFIDGLLLGFAYVAPIGVQNIFVINSAISDKRMRSFLTALIVIFFDITLALACFWGVGSLFENAYILKMVVYLVGGIAVVKIGHGLLNSEIKAPTESAETLPISKVIVSACLVTWFNPQALIDGSLLLGAYRASLAPNFALLFIVGVCIASMTWFVSLSSIIATFKYQMSVKILTIINRVCGIVIVFYGLRLIYIFLENAF
ncbi:LysE/ArgO family amino acid transporter [Fusibacter ferrireducens]|uniref:LysE family transporter n=1 Tax=Fusibacter ferrireducens TaxID=2785058 RepID=A0ABR9ZQD3_9FIRM|nr:LysE family transporter [Fusibacter ferrireducens]MBF4692672.1 LysE family transporter [Fusibacter ferrireducens]